MARSFTTHLTSFVVHRVRFGPDSLESGPNLSIVKVPIPPTQETFILEKFFGENNGTVPFLRNGSVKSETHSPAPGQCVFCEVGGTNYTSKYCKTRILCTD